MRVVPLRIEEAERFMRTRRQRYNAPREPIFALGVIDDDEELCGALIAGRLSQEEACLAHVCSDGVPGGFTMLYGQCWRALKALGYKRAVL